MKNQKVEQWVLADETREGIAQKIYSGSVRYWTRITKKKSKQPPWDELTETEKGDYLNSLDIAFDEFKKLNVIYVDPRTKSVLDSVKEFRGFENHSHLIIQLICNTLEMESMEQFAIDTTQSLDDANEKLDRLLKQ